MFDIDDYYLGVVLASPNYYKNSNTQNRLITSPCADPFQHIPMDQALVTGNVVILKKKNDTYYDEEYSIYTNELSYH